MENNKDQKALEKGTTTTVIEEEVQAAEAVKVTDDDSKLVPFPIHMPNEICEQILKHFINACSPNHQSLKQIRQVSPFFYLLVSENARFIGSTSYHLRRQKFAVFWELAQNQNTWGDLAIEVFRDSMTGPLPASFVQYQYHLQLSTLSFFHCSASPPSFYLSSIVDQCTVVKSLAIGYCPDFIPIGQSQETTVTGVLPLKWSSIKALTLINDSKGILHEEIMKEILLRISGLTDLAVIGPRRSIPTTKRDWLKVTDKHKQQWKLQCEVLTRVVLPFILQNVTTLRSLDLSNHPMICDSGFLEDMFYHNVKPELSQFSLNLCNIPVNKLHCILANMPTITCLSVSILGEKCKHDPQFYGQYYTYLSRKTVKNIQILDVNFSKKLNCFCFLKFMDNLKELSISYNYHIYNRRLMLKDDGLALTKFIFIGNNQTGFRISQVFLKNVTYLDLSFSNAVHGTDDFNHICEYSKKLTVLKLSGCKADIELKNLKELEELVELRFRHCLEIRPEEFEKHIQLPKLEVLDLALTRVTCEGVFKILISNRSIKHVDVRGCSEAGGMQFEQKFKADLSRFSYVRILRGRLKKKMQARLPNVESSNNEANKEENTKESQ